MYVHILAQVSAAFKHTFRRVGKRIVRRRGAAMRHTNVPWQYMALWGG